jgi:ubiquinone/menaquinone biosynthesis C-methylase UbiE
LQSHRNPVTYIGELRPAAAFAAFFSTGLELDNFAASSFNTFMSKKHKELVQTQFTKTAEAFTKFAVRDTPEVLKEKVDFVKPQATDVALDVACGPGAFALAIAPHVHSSWGVDLTEEMLRRARGLQAEKQISNAGFVRGEAEQLPFRDSGFDLVSCQCSFHHLPKPALVLAEMVRVAKPEGRLLIIDPLGPESDAKFELYNRIEVLRDPSHTLTVRLTEFLRMFDEAGLEILRQSLRRRQRSFNNWMLRGGHAPDTKRYLETRKLMESSVAGDKAGFSAQLQGEDIQIVHHEGMFLLTRKQAMA